MPPKKASAATEAAADGEKKFSWTAENDRKLLILTIGRTLTTDDYHKLVEAMPGTNYNGVRIRISKFRVEQRKLFEELGWPAIDGSSTASGKKDGVGADNKTGKRKRGKAAGDGEAPQDGDEKVASKKTKKEVKKEVKTEDDEMPSNDFGGEF